MKFIEFLDAEGDMGVVSIEDIVAIKCDEYGISCIILHGGPELRSREAVKTLYQRVCAACADHGLTDRPFSDPPSSC